MAILTLRSAKGSELTFNEADDNFVEAARGGRRNYILNGGFEVNQSGIDSIPLVNTFGYLPADGWKGLNGADVGSYGAGTHSRELFTPGQTDVPGEPKWYLRWNQTVAGNSSGRTLQVNIEDVRTLAGSPATLSFYARSPGNISIPIGFQQIFGTGGSGVVGTAAGTAQLTSAWFRYSFSFNVPSISGKTISGGVSSIAVVWPLPGSTTFQFDLACPQLEAGSVVTPFEIEAYGDTLRRCQRYFQTSRTQAHGYSANTYAGVAHAVTGAATAANYAWGANTTLVPKVKEPVVSLYSPATGAKGKVYNYTLDTEVDYTSVLHTSTESLGVVFFNTAVAANTRYAYHWDADSRI